MAAAFKSALPAHLNPKSALGGNGDSNVEFARKHHGKTQSHMVSTAQKLLQMMECMAGPWEESEGQLAKSRLQAELEK